MLKKIIFAVVSSALLTIPERKIQNGICTQTQSKFSLHFLKTANNSCFLKELLLILFVVFKRYLKKLEHE